ncbi:MAG: pilus assembly protein TadG-related protein [Pseudomonadota bacterium]
MPKRFRPLSALAAVGQRARDSFHRFRRDTTGGVAAIVTIVSPVLIGGMGLGGEAGYWYLTQREVQNAADVAAHATAMKLNDGATEAELLALAEYLVGQASVEITNASIEMNQPPVDGIYIEDGSAVEIIVTETVPRMFSAIYSSDPVTITARSVATAQGGGAGCIVALDEANGGEGIDVASSVFLTTIMCDIVSNETGAASQEFHPGSTVSTNCLQATGEIAMNGFVNQICGAAKQNAAPMSDPFASLAEPSAVGACNTPTVSNTTVTPVESHPSGMTSIRYCNGMTIDGAVTLSPGLYIIEGGDLNINAGSTLNAADVMFYLASDSQMNMATTASVTMSPPTTGTYAGMSFFGSRTATGRTHSLGGGFGSIMDGTIYAPTSRLSIGGTVSTSFTSCTQLLGDDIQFQSFAVATIHCLFPAGPVASSPGQVAIVE